MDEREKVLFYDQYRETIHPIIKSKLETKPLWRRLFWTTGRDSDQYKSGCVDIFCEYCPDLFNTLMQNQ